MRNQRPQVPHPRPRLLLCCSRQVTRRIDRMAVKNRILREFRVQMEMLQLHLSEPVQDATSVYPQSRRTEQVVRSPAAALGRESIASYDRSADSTAGQWPSGLFWLRPAAPARKHQGRRFGLTDVHGFVASCLLALRQCDSEKSHHHSWLPAPVCTCRPCWLCGTCGKRAHVRRCVRVGAQAERSPQKTMRVLWVRGSICRTVKLKVARGVL